MELHDIFEHTPVRPLSRWGYTGNFWEINLDTIVLTWVALLFLAGFVVLVRRSLKNPFSLFSYGVEKVAGYFISLIKDGIGRFDQNIFAFVMGITLFTLFCNLIEILPFVEPATGDVNTTLAIGISCFTFVQYQGIKHRGREYFTKFFHPFFLFFPINVLGQLSKIASLSFRLFGNILSGTIIITLLLGIFEQFQSFFVGLAVTVLIASFIIERSVSRKRYPRIIKIVSFGTILVSIVPGAQIIFSVGEGFIQAFVIGLMTTMYLSAEIGESGGH